MSRTTKFSVSLWLAIPITLAICGLAMAGKKPPQNHAPVLDPYKSPVLATENWNSGAPSGAVGTLVSALVDFAVPAGQVDNVTDVDAGAKLGIAVVFADTTNGSWWYSINNGTSWNVLGSVAVNKARLLAADANSRLYFRPNANFYGTFDGTDGLSTSVIQFHAWDQTSGTNGALQAISSVGGSTAFSAYRDLASLMVKWLPPATTPPPVEYQLSWIDAGDDYPYGSRPSDINNSGVVVGGLAYPYPDGGLCDSSAYRWSLVGGLELLDSLSAIWVDLNDNSTVTGWRTWIAKDINDSGQIVGGAVFAAVGQRPAAGRGFLFDETGQLGPPRTFYLLPTMADTAAAYFARTVNEEGQVLGDITIGWPDVNSTTSLFFWDPLNSGTLTPFLPGHNCDRMSGQHFSVQSVDTDAYSLYSYSVDAETGVFNWLFDSEFSADNAVGHMSGNSLVPFTTKSVAGPTTRYAVSVYDALNRQTIPLSPSNTGQIGSANSSGDVLFDGDAGVHIGNSWCFRGDLKLYRRSENATYSIRDLLDASARAELSPYTIVGQRALVNDSNVASVPIADPYDHIAGHIPWPPDHSYPGKRGFVLTPVRK